VGDLDLDGRIILKLILKKYGDAQDRFRWQALVNMMMKHHIS
jgi:hypothetical protein